MAATGLGFDAAAADDDDDDDVAYRDCTCRYTSPLCEGILRFKCGRELVSAPVVCVKGGRSITEAGRTLDTPVVTG
jgi:hypothetical protein